MNIALDRFCINRKIAPNLDLDNFFRLVKRCGLSKVELRNDMPSGKVSAAERMMSCQPQKLILLSVSLNMRALSRRCSE